MDYKLLISDFDGTLAGRDGAISTLVSSSIKKWIGSGKSFSIATGKQYATVEDNIQMLGLISPQIVRGGAEIVDPKTGEVIYSQLINKDVAKEFIDFMVSQNYQIIIEEDNKYYSNFGFNSGYSKIEYLAMDEFKLKPIPKIVIWLQDKDIKDADRLLDEVVLKKFPQLHIVRSYTPMGKVWDVTSLSATKHLATLELMKLLNIAREETVGVGDGYNDFSLLEACGYKVAMANAPEDLKAIADLIVPSYQEDGVAVLIEKLLAL